MPRSTYLLAITLVSLALYAPACSAASAPDSQTHDALPEPVLAMIDAAIATGDKAKVETVVAIAKQTNPKASDEIEALHLAFLEHEQTLSAKKAADQEAAIRSAGFLERWKGKGELGASRATGTSNDLGLTAALALDRSGIAWSHKLRAQVDYQRTNGATSRERYLASYEPHYAIHKDFFFYALAQFESDRVQGFEGRYTLSGGVGYKIIDLDHLDLSVKGGPTFRYTHFLSEPAESRLAALIGFDLGWQISPHISLSQQSNAVAHGGGQALVVSDSSNTSIDVVTALDAKISDHLSNRISYELNYNSNPPAGVVKTSTISRFSIVYGF